MISEYADVAFAAKRLKFHVPIGLHTDHSLGVEAENNGTFDDIIHWFHYLTSWHEQIDEDHKRASAMLRRRQLRDEWIAQDDHAREMHRRREDALWEYRQVRHQDRRLDPCGIMEDWLLAHEVRVGHRVPRPMFRKRVHTDRFGEPNFCVGTYKEQEPYERLIGPRLAPRYAESFPQARTYERRETDHGFAVMPGILSSAEEAAAYEEHLAVEFPEIRGGAFVHDNGLLDDLPIYEAHEGCQRCKRGDALCVCGNPVDLEDLNVAVAYGRLQETLAALEHIASAIEHLEGRRSNLPSRERARLEEIQRLAREEDHLRRVAYAQRRELIDTEGGDACPRPVREEKWAVGYAGFGASTDLADLAFDERREQLRRSASWSRIGAA